MANHMDKWQAYVLNQFFCCTFIIGSSSESPVALCATNPHEMRVGIGSQSDDMIESNNIESSLYLLEFTPSYILHTRAFGTYLLGGLFTLQKIL
jgi:hypothetical protein